MSDLLWTLLKVTAAVILAAKVLRDFQHSAEQCLKREEKENTRKVQLPDAYQNNNGNI